MALGQGYPWGRPCHSGVGGGPEALESDRPGFKSQLHHLSARRPWPSYFTSQSFIFFGCKMGIKIAATSQGDCEGVFVQSVWHRGGTQPKVAVLFRAPQTSPAARSGLRVPRCPQGSRTLPAVEVGTGCEPTPASPCHLSVSLLGPHSSDPRDGPPERASPGFSLAGLRFF